MRASNIVLLEHVNLIQPDQQLATLFYVVGLGFTRDPYLMVGLDNMWINIGQTQMHLPTGPAQRLRGTVRIVVPDLAACATSLQQVARPLEGSAFSVEQEGNALQLRCPWGNRFIVEQADPERWGGTRLGIVELALEVAPGTAAGIARFYERILHAPARLEGGAAIVQAGQAQQLRFVETDEPAAPYDGHHIQIYLADPQSPFDELRRHGLVTRAAGPHDWRFTQIVDPENGDRLFELEHEVRGIAHPLYARPLVNRNPAQRNSGYHPGADALEF